MRILITGNMGYVGPVVSRHLRQRFGNDVELIGFDSGLFAHCLTTAAMFPETVLNAQYFGDVRDISAGFLRGFDGLVHLAAISNDPMGQRFEIATDNINRGATIRLARLAADAGIERFVFASSCSVYGLAAGSARRESDPVDPLTQYARSKIESERALQALGSTGMSVTCLRFATACGMSPRLRLDLVLNDFVAGAVATGEISILSDGSPWRPLIHVDDMALAIEWALTREVETHNRFLTVNAGSNAWNYQVIDLARAVAARVPNVKLSVNSDAPPDKRSYRVDFGLFSQLAPDHQPRVDLARAIDGLVDGLGAIGFRDEAYRTSGRMRLKVLAEHVDANRVDSDLRWISQENAVQ